MLTAILHGKAGRTELDGQNVSWRDVFRKREDLLTSVFFGRLLYLSKEGQIAVLKLLVGDLSSYLGPILEVEFWPRLKGPTARRYVEPDVILHFAQHLILVEVKAPEGQQQSRQQWLAEIQALQERNDDAKKITLLALGRNLSAWRGEAQALTSELEDLELRVFCREWHDLKRYLDELADCFEDRDARVIHDWHEAFLLFGLPERLRPFVELLPLLTQPDCSQACLALLSHWPKSSHRKKGRPKSIDWLPLLQLAQIFKQENEQCT